MTTTRTISSLAACAAAALLTSCVTVSESNPTPPLIKPSRVETGTPTKIIVSPLTRVGIDPSGDPALFLHLDFRTANDRSIKAFGKLRAELFQPAASDGTPAQPARSWDADLADSFRNALSYDEMITRTYAITLGGLPDWLVQWSRHEAATPAPTIVVQFIPTNSSDSPPLRTTYTLTR